MATLKLQQEPGVVTNIVPLEAVQALADNATRNSTAEPRLPDQNGRRQTPLIEDPTTTHGDAGTKTGASDATSAAGASSKVEDDGGEKGEVQNRVSVAELAGAAARTGEARRSDLEHAAEESLVLDGSHEASVQ